MAVYRGSYLDYAISFSKAGNLKGTVTDLVAGRDGSDSVKNVEYLLFSNALYDVGSDTFYYVNSNNAPVVATPIADQSVLEDNALDFTVPENTFSDPDGNPLTYSAALASGGALPAWLSFNATTRAFTGTPPQDSNVPLTVRVTASDGTASVSDDFQITITPVNDAPVAQPLSVSGPEDTAIGGTVVGADVDNAAAQLNYTLVGSNGGAAHGTVSMNAGGTFSYMPAANYSGTDTFTYKVSDGGPLTSNAVVTVTVSPVADAPTLNVADASGAVDAAIPLTIGAALVDNDGSETLSIVIAGVPDGAALSNGTKKPDGTWTLNSSQLAGLTITPGEESDPSFDLTVTATSSEGAATESVTKNIHVSLALEGRAVDGYIVGATVFADANTNGVLDAGEAFTTTGANGYFALAGGTGPLVLKGGTDISTGLAFTGVLKAPAGSTVVTPLTTLIAAIAPVGATAAELAAAEDQVKVGLGLPPGVDLTTFDPVLAAQTGDPVTAALGLEIYSAGVQLQNTIALAASLISGSDSSAVSFDTAAASVIEALASQVAAATAATPVDLTNAATAESIVTAAAVDTGTTLTTEQITFAGATLENANTSVADAGDLTEVAQTAVVTQGDAVAAVADGNVTNNTNYAAPATFTAEAAAAEVGIVGVTTAGTSGNDTLNGTAGADALDGLAGDDTINGGLGDDYLFGGTGRDRLRGEGGDDQLFGDAGNDVLTGGAGNDIINGGENLAGQLSDSDTANYDVAGVTTGVTVNLATGIASDGFGGTDTLSNIERVIGTSFADVLTGGNQTNSGQGISEQFEGRGGDDTITGAIDNNLVLYDNAASGISVNLSTAPIVHVPTGVTLAAGTVLDGDGGTDTLTNINRIRGSAYDDIMYGSNPVSNQRFEGLAGNDYIDGRGGTDYVMFQNAPAAATVTFSNVTFGNGTASDGHGTTDTFFGMEGVRGSAFNDVLTGSDRTDVAELFEGMAGNDSITGGGGNDRVEYGQAPGGVIVNLRAAAVTVAGVTVNGLTALDGFGTIDTFTGIEQATGSRFDDYFAGNAGSNRFDGGVGFDTVSFDGLVAGVNFSLGTVGPNIEKVIGTSFNDTLTGATANDVLEGGDGNDVLVGNEGDDTLRGGAGDDRLNGSAGTDLIDGGDGNDTLDRSGGTTGQGIDLMLGTHGVDTLISIENAIGSPFLDTIRGDNNANRLEGRGGNDNLRGEGGDDTYVYAPGDGGDSIIDSSGTDTLAILGTPGNEFLNVLWFGSATGMGMTGIENVTLDLFNGVDTLSYAGTTANLNVTLGGAASGFTGNILGVETLIGGSGNDTLSGNGASETLSGGDGNDVIKTNGGNDVVNGGNGVDTLDLSGDVGTPKISLLLGTIPGGTHIVNQFENVIGSFGADDIQGDNLANTISGGNGNDILKGEAGNDVLNGGFADDILNGGGGDDTLSGSDGNDSLQGGTGNDSLDGGFGDDTYTYVAGDGTDTLFDSSGAGIDTLNVVGTPGDDFLNVVWSGAGVISQIAGGTIGNIESVTLGLGTGLNDTLNYTTTTANLTVNLTFAASGFNGVITGVEHVTGGSGNDTITGNGANNIINGGAGDDWISSGDGNDTIDGGDGIDTFDVSADFGAHHISLLSTPPTAFDTVLNVENVIGSAGSDQIEGSFGANSLSGGASNDLITGRAGADVLTGGAGADTFRWLNGDQSPSGVIDSIMDFDSIASSDKLNLGDLLQGEHSGTAGSLENFLGFSYDGAKTTIDVDVHGFGLGIEQKIQLVGVDLTALGTLTETQIINNLLAGGKLSVDF